MLYSKISLQIRFDTVAHTCMYVCRTQNLSFSRGTNLDCAALAKDDGDTVHINHHSPDVGNLRVTSSVLILGVHGKVRQVRGNVAGFAQGVGAGSHIMVGVFVKGGVVRISGY